MKVLGGIMDWVVFLTGDKNDLQILSEDLKNPDFTIERDNTIYILKSPHFASLTTDHEVREKTNEFLTLLNAGIKLDLAAFEKIKISHTMQINPDGTKMGYVICEGACICVRALPSTVEINGKRIIENRANLTCILSKIAKSNVLVAKVCQYINQDFSSWHTLYKIYEVIENDGFSPIQRNGIYRKRADLFRRTANNPSSSGLNSRHAQDNSPPENPMTLSESQDFIKMLIGEWLETKQERLT